MAVSSPAAGVRHEISPYQWAVLAAAGLGWALDGFDFTLFTQVAGPASTALTGHSAPFYSGLVVTIYLLGWAVGAVIFGALADYVGRVRILIIGVLTYSVFTALAALSVGFWDFAVMRFIAGTGSGVELPIGAALVAEAWNNRHRAKATGVMMSGLSAGALLAAVVYGFVGGFGWRVPMAVGLLPALLVLFIRRNVHEPESMAEVKARRVQRRKERAAGAGKTTEDHFVLTRLFRRPLLGRTLACTTICIGGLFAFWSITTWTPQDVRFVAAQHGITGAAAIGYVSWGTAMLNIGGLLGYASWGFLADKIGRKRMFVVSLLIGAVATGILFPFGHSITMYMILLPVVGFGVFAIFAGTAVFFPELFEPAVRASALSVTNSVGRVLTAAGPMVAGIIATQWFAGSIPLATTVMAGLLLLSFIGLAFVPESHGRFIFAGTRAPAIDGAAVST